ncbi:carbamoyltransferase [Streptomyces violaceoruber]|uniref:carbamoyltransferase family protein n=1 Tax=Streptomyces violaceoruber TaxID=1935 RepID=UPI001F336ADC|nr:carbamoyltransferase C-terminal domain-containing protein [Streptomyces violaceoruber]MCF3165780.1 carbamoyltransferase [Streptomyces violaceoruber]
MITLGITGSFADLSGTFMPDVPEWLFHDSAAALVVDGVVVAAVEEERLNRIKHSNKFPQLAAQSCLELAGIKASDIDDIAFFFGEDYADLELRYEYLKFPDVPALPARELLTTRLGEALGRDFRRSEINFVRHHHAHAFGSHSDSGFDESLAVVIDGNGEAESVSVFHGRAGELELLRSYPAADSLGHLYLSLLPLMGFRRFDEYKVMGLAPFGDPHVYLGELRKFYSLGENGDFTMDSKAVLENLMETGFTPRRRGEKIRQQDKDLAAALQSALEEVKLHLLRYWAGHTGVRNLALSGGVAHNSSANGRVLQSGIFDKVFVHPAAHDAGASAGAAQFRQAQVTGARKGGPLRDLFLGPELGGRSEVAREVRRWQDFLTVEPLEEGTEGTVAAAAVADGEVIGWARGRSEFGPRALGHRSILADPRRGDNRERVNAMIKKREGFRPFAPAVLAEHAAEVFDLTSTDASLEFMSYVVDVRPQWRDRLPAITHVDGTARVQTVFPDRNPALWQIIEEFRARTGVPVVLNTSFNNFAEPIVQSIRDVLRCLLTTTLDAAILPGHRVRRREDLVDAVLAAPVVFHPTAEVRRISRAGGGRPATELVATYQYAGARSTSLSAAMFDFLSAGNGEPRSLASTGVRASTAEGRELAEEVLRLWEHRVIDLDPQSGS